MQAEVNPSQLLHVYEHSAIPLRFGRQVVLAIMDMRVAFLRDLSTKSVVGKVWARGVQYWEVLFHSCNTMLSSFLWGLLPLTEEKVRNPFRVG